MEINVHKLWRIRMTYSLAHLGECNTTCYLSARNEEDALSAGKASLHELVKTSPYHASAERVTTDIYYPRPVRG